MTVKDSARTYQLTKTIQKRYIDSLKDWKGYHLLHEVLEEMEEVSARQILERSPELLEKSSLMKDSLDIAILKNVGMRARMRTIHNTILRMQDMTKIPSIKAKEVEETAKELFVLFDILNTKINDVYAQIDFKKTLTTEAFFFNEKDSLSEIKRRQNLKN